MRSSAWTFSFGLKKLLCFGAKYEKNKNNEQIVEERERRFTRPFLDHKLPLANVILLA